MYCSLFWLTLLIGSGISIPQLSIAGIVTHGRCYISHCFFNFFLPVVVLIVFLQCLYSSDAYKPDQFLVLIKVSFFFNLSFCPSFKSNQLLLSNEVTIISYYYHYCFYYCFSITIFLCIDCFLLFCFFVFFFYFFLLLIKQLLFFSHTKRLRLVDYFVSQFVLLCFLS